MNQVDDRVRDLGASFTVVNEIITSLISDRANYKENYLGLMYNRLSPCLGDHKI